MEINVALDEMLGLRGPFSALIRNMLWLLAFNATYLGIFGFVPKTVGSVAYSGIFNTTFCLNVVKAVPFVYSEDQNQTTVMSVLSRLEEESNERSTTFKLSDVATVILGYLSIASLIVLTRYATVIFQKMGQKFGRNSLRRTINQEARHFHRANAGHAAIDPDGIDAVDGEAGMNSVAGGLDTMVSIVKVGVLLFLKMFLLPLFLGFCLDASTVRLFGHDLDRRLAFAGSDLFSFILLHWVSGITFMLLVTVFLLQLREVAHPDVLARVIRPQEPQPDLLGNLLHETVTTHMKRMFLSLVIYAPLLMLQISLPIRLFLESGLAEKVTFFQLNFYHVLMPQLQIPLELITFHLSMLALLERYKNSIGGMQHKWLKFICNITGLTEYLLPKEIAGFERIGSKSVFLPKEAGDLEVDSFFLKMAKVKSSTAGEELIVSTFSGSQSQSRMIVQGETRENGERVLVADTMHIALPFAGRSDSDSSDASMEQTAFLPTKIGRYRLRLQDENEVMQPTIEIFREVLGDVIKRPPDGWDDLGVGGAWVQGRWAWSTERKSVIEAGVAQRIPFRVLPNRRWSVSLLAKIGLLLFSSWLAITLAAVAMLSAPLAVGRSFYYLLRIPTKFIHDPFAFCIGAALFFPAASMIIRNVRETDESHLKRLGHWLSKFKLPPVKKFCVLAEAFLLWFLVAPIILGVSYEITFVKPSEWFSQGGSLLELKTLVFSWLMGTVVLNTWSFLLYFKCFTKRFWANIGNGILEPPMDENGNFIPLARNQDPRDEVNGNENAWQGNGGRAAAFFITWRTVLRNWEWDAVDRVPLLEEFARPVTRQIASAFVGSSLSFQILLYIVATACPTQGNDFVLPLVGPVFQGTFCMMVYRLCSLSHVLLQLSSSFRDSIDVWFEAAHEAARDGRYLIGERLLNYEEDLDSTRIAS
jgi:E3 ubiquitin-protein ligase MARCH6